MTRKRALRLLLACAVAAPVFWSLTPIGGFGGGTDGRLRTAGTFLLMFGSLFAALDHPRSRARIFAFFTRADTSFNLEFARVWVFAYVMGEAPRYADKLAEYLERPRSLYVPFRGIDTHAIWPSNELLEFLGSTLEISALFACVGLFTRVSTLWCAVSLFYTMGTFYSFGKVSHFHHLFWAVAILAAAPCGRRFSLDALLRSTVFGRDAPVRRHWVYALPLATLWLQIGIAYMSAGIPKWTRNGVEWFLSDSPINTFYRKWYVIDWVPSIRIDQWPDLMRLGALGVICFELSFIVLIFIGPRMRVAAAAGAYAFHRMNGFFLRIHFHSMQHLLFLLVDWQAGLRWLGRRLWPEPLSIRVDPAAGAARRAGLLADRFDVFDTLRLESAAPASGAAIEVSDGERTARDAEALRILCRRSPFLWWLLPFAGRLAGGGAAPAVTGGAPDAVRSTSIGLARIAPIVVVLVFTSANLYYCFTREGSGYPFAAYPAFSALRGEDYDEVSFVVDGREVPLLTLHERDAMSRNEVANWSRRILKRMRAREARKMWNYLLELDPTLPRAGSVDIYAVTVSVIPEQRGRELSRKRLYGFTYSWDGRDVESATYEFVGDRKKKKRRSK